MASQERPTEANQFDPESVAKRVENVDSDSVQSGRSGAKLRAGAFLAFVSLVLLAESIFRILSVTQTNAATDYAGKPGVFPPVVLLLGGIFELLFAMLGVVVGLGVSLFDLEHQFLTIVLMVFQVVLGSYTYVVFTLAMPSFYINIQKRGGSAETAASVFGWVFVAMAFDGIAMGGQFFLALQLSHLQGSSTGSLGASYHKLRVGLFSGLVFLAGLGFFISACIIRSEWYNDMYNTTYYYPGANTINNINVNGKPWRPFGPLFGMINALRWPGITIVSGLLQMLYAMIGLGTAGNAAAYPAMHGMGIFLWLWTISCQVLVQFGTVMLPASLAGLSPLAGNGVITALLSTTMVFVPLYYGREAHRYVEVYDP